MKTFRIITLSLLITLSTFSTAEAQTTISGNGRICSGVVSECGTFTLTFNPRGGAVSGSMRYVVTTRTQTSTVVDTTTATLSGTFDGGDGGRISGTASGQSVSSSGGSISFSGSWEGWLRADGSGDGSWSTSSKYLQCTRACVWNVNYSAEAFRSALSTVTPTTAPKPTLTSTAVAVIAKNITLDPMVKTFVAISPNLDQATKTILNQDSALIARDDKNNFYAINNQGKSIPLPPALGAMIKFSHNFAVLNNEQLLASSEHSSVRGTINGGGDFVYLNKIPPEMKDKDYVAFATTCSLTRASLPLAALTSNFLSQEIDQCRPEVRVNSTATSIKVGGAALGGENQDAKSSEHSSVRGTINGSGDFIFDPPLITLASYTQQTQKPFVGVQYELNDRGALVKMVVASSPADKAGLKLGDVIQKADGKTITAQQTLAAIIRARAVGDSIPLTVLRNSQTVNLNLRVGASGSPIIYTPSATIYPGDATLVIDIGFNGFTGVYVINGKARVGDVDVVSGDAVIVAPMNKVSKPITLNTNEVTRWWDETPAAPPLTATPDSKIAPTSAATPDRTPTPDNDLSTAITNALMAGGAILLCGLGLFGVGAVLWFVRRS
ncbi:MAG: PDZ domain-containing protein [Chloroflexi bacterium]|nr:PDZ domain-containing protein [Chloroflexota bacterium]